MNRQTPETGYLFQQLVGNRLRGHDDDIGHARLSHLEEEAPQFLVSRRVVDLPGVYDHLGVLDQLLQQVYTCTVYRD